MIDWYNFIIQHNPTPAGFKSGKGNAYETPLRDKKHGRIYRITHGPRGAGPATLDAAALSHPNMFWRLQAQRRLVEQGDKGVVPALEALVRDPGMDEIGINPGAIHALWTLHGLGVLKPELSAAGLKHPSAGVRRAALQTLGSAAEALPSLKDAEASVRLAALLALAGAPGTAESGRAAAPLLAEEDRWIPLAAVAAGARSPLDFLEAAAKLRDTRSAREAVRAVAVHLAMDPPTGAPDRIVTGLASATPGLAEEMLAGLASAWPEGNSAGLETTPPTTLERVSKSLPSRAAISLVSLARKWKAGGNLEALSATQRETLLRLLADPATGAEERLAAVRNIVLMGLDGASAKILLDLVSPKSGPALVKAVLESLGESTFDELGNALVARWPELTPAARAASIALLLRRPAWTRALLDGLEAKRIDATDLALDQAQQLSRNPDDAIKSRAVKLLSGVGRLPNPDRQKVLDALLPLADRRGDAAAGKAVFEKNCSKCHRLGDLGQSVGPDLTGIAARDRKDILVDVLDPNRSVEGNFKQFVVKTRKDAVVNGLLAAETQTAVEILDSEGKRHVILRQEIDRMIASTSSLMPEGFEKLPEAELVSLLEFLGAREKFMPLPLAKAATVASDRGMFHNKNAEAERLIFAEWGAQKAFGVPFHVIDPRDGTVPNVILLHGPEGELCRGMPRSVVVPCNSPARAIHLLGGVSGWGSPFGAQDSVSMIVRLKYADGATENHPLLNGVHFADYIRVVDVPGSKLAFKLRGQQVRYLSITPMRPDKIATIEFVKGDDRSAPVVMAVTLESP